MVKMRLGGKIAIVGISSPFVLIVGLLLIVASADYHRVKVLQERGIKVDAAVVGLRRTTEKGVDRYHVTYAYRAIDDKAGYYGKIEAERLTSVEEFQRLQIGSSVPVIYDPVRADRHMQISTADLKTMSPSKLSLPITIFGGALLLVGLLCCGSLYMVYRRQKKLLTWGQPAQARLIGEREYQMKGPVADVTYEFTDSKGRKQTGIIKMLPVKSDTRANFIEYRERRLGNPIVLFLPEDSRRNALYPFSLAEITK